MTKYLLTGASGFLGSVIKAFIESKESIVHTLGRSNENSISIDLSKGIPSLETSYDIVIHCAGKAHSYPKTDLEKQAFFDVNYKATVNLCLALESLQKVPSQFVFISSVAVYGLSHGNLINENYGLKAKDPYGFSKIQAEKFLIEWGKKMGSKILILRLPLIVGANPPGNLGKMIASIKRGTYLSIDKGKARKSMVLANDVAHLIKKCPNEEGVFNLTDGFNPSFAELESIISSQLNKSKAFNLPLGFAKFLGKIGDWVAFFPLNTSAVNKIVLDLTFSDTKARQELGWNPSSVIKNWKI